jgi:dTDP-4-amino-4,6-dideoxygalactose transaminase
MDPYRRFSRDNNPASDSLHKELLCVPLYVDLPLSDIDRICDVILEVLDHP